MMHFASRTERKGTDTKVVSGGGKIDRSEINACWRSEKIWRNRAVHETTLDIRAGEFVSIIGPSGSGKTTLLTMVAGFEQPTNGRIIVGDVDITTLPPNRRNVGMVFQKYALFPI